MATAELLFGLKQRVPRRPYVAWGLGLAVVKFAIDTLIVRGFTGQTWSPLGYLLPSLALRSQSLGSVPQAMYVVLVLAALPFLWVGLSMSVRRAADAGRSPWLGTLFLLPGVNYLLIALLCLLPTRLEARWGLDETLAAPDGPIPSGLRAALLGMAASVGLGLGMTLLGVQVLGTYGTVLFFVTPFAMGATTAAIYNWHHPRPLGETVLAALGAMALTGGAMLLFAIEGLLCLMMALPLAAVIVVVGAIVGRAIALRQPSAPTPASLLVMMPLLAAGEARLAAPTLRHTTTTIEIDAPPEKIWPNVIGFSELPPAPEWFFRLGIAHPQRARIEGSGVGAVRHCEFSTGAFVEPITVWEPGRRLAFDVTSQPPSMAEWSPYRELHAPHLTGYMVSKGGEFRLTPLSAGRTRLEGTTHYTLAIYPEMYWIPWSEGLLHAIHHRVLGHIKNLSESSGG